MDWDIVIPGVMVVATAIMAYLGTLHQPKTNNALIFYRWLFVALSLLIVGFTIWQAVRSKRSQVEAAQQNADLMKMLQEEQKVSREERETGVLIANQLGMSLQQQEYMRGRLDSITAILGKMSETQNEVDLSRLAAAVRSAIRAPVEPRPAAPVMGVACDFNKDGFIDVRDVQLVANLVLGASQGKACDINGDGMCNVADVQRVVSASLGQPCREGLP